MAVVKDLTNRTFGRLKALRCVGRTKRGNAVWFCRCSCDGKEVEVTNSHLVSGHTTSCGCIQIEACTRTGLLNAGKRRGSERDPINDRAYKSWSSMIQRCTNPKTERWSHYGGANPPVTVCERWLNSFETFLDDLGNRPSGSTLSRYLDFGNYEPGIVEWAVSTQQTAEGYGKKAMQSLHAYHYLESIFELERAA